MENNKPNVFPTSNKMTDAMREANETGQKIAEQAKSELGIQDANKNEAELSAQAQMIKDSQEQLEEQIRRRDELFASKKESKNEVVSNEVTYSKPETKPHKNIELPDEDDKYASLMIPQDDEPFDLVKLPSEGLLYKNCKSSLKVAYLNASDENIITNPNLLRSGKFLEVLINRKWLILVLDIKIYTLVIGMLL